jgi:hypothetical protein
MVTGDELPVIDDCLDLYLQIHERFGTSTFRPERLAEDAADVDRPLTHLLDLLVAYGLLDRRADGQYRIRCAPDDDLDRWRTAADSRAERLHRLVGRESDGAPVAADLLTHEGGTFVSVHVGPDADFDAVETALVDALTVRASRDGVVVRSPGDLAADVQRFADRLCDRGVEARDWRFEKVATDLIGAGKDDLEFRLFLSVTT